MKSGTKKKSRPSSKMSWKQVQAFLLQPVGKRSGWPVIEKQEMEVFCLLDQSGLSFQQNIELSFKQSQKIQDLLNQGIPFYKIVSRQKGLRMKRMGVLMDHFALSQALEYDQRLQSAKTVMTRKLFSHTVYPLMIMAFATGLVWFFSLTILPAFGEYASDNNALLDSLKLFTSVFWMLLGVFALFLGALFVWPDVDSSKFNPLFRLSLVRIVASIECAALFECTQNSSLPTSQTLQLMQNTGSFPFAALLARKWSKSLSKGKSLFVQFFEIGLNASLMEKMMQAYQKSALMILEKRMKKLANYTLYLAYGSVGILAVSVYQVMLAPLSILETL